MELLSMLERLAPILAGPLSSLVILLIGIWWLVKRQDARELLDAQRQQLAETERREREKLMGDRLDQKEKALVQLTLEVCKSNNAIATALERIAESQSEQARAHGQVAVALERMSLQRA